MFTALLGIAIAASPPQLERMALVVGSNSGGPRRAALRHAESDARAMARVLETLGGVRPSNDVILLAPNREGLRTALGQMKTRLASAAREKRRTELVFYFSGHSDEEGLLLSDGRFDYRDLRAALLGLPTDFRVTILDSCSSGAFTQLKGGVHMPPFLVDASSAVKGQAVLTSSSATEASQESDAVGGSFFTHNLVSGLRGAADSSRDGKVTLNEVYQFAFHQTLARTERTQAGAQHPAYAIEVAGTGDVVLTDLRATNAGLILPASLAGHLFVRDGSSRLLVELQKAPLEQVELGLEPGEYSVTLVTPRGTYAGNVELYSDRKVTFSSGSLVEVPEEATVRRGAVEEQPIVAREDRLALQLLGATGLSSGIVSPGLDVGIDYRWRTFFAGMNAGLLLPAWSTRGRTSLLPHLGAKFAFGAFELAGSAGVGATTFLPPDLDISAKRTVVSFNAAVALAIPLGNQFDLFARFNVALADTYAASPGAFCTLGVGIQARFLPRSLD